MQTLHWLDASVLLAYFLVMISIGVCSARRVKNMDDYYLMVGKA